MSFFKKIKYYFRHWFLMLSKKSVEHVEQGLGKQFVVGHVKGYFNDMTGKVLFQKDIIENDELPKVKTIDKGYINFPVAIFQFGLGLYDMYLETNDEKYISKFYQCADWALNNQLENGAWDNFSFIYPNYPYGAMCQGEGISLLVRAYLKSGNQKYLLHAKKAFDFMSVSINDGGTTYYSNDGDVIFLEYPQFKEVLNGWIFALFGVYDLSLVISDTKVKKLLNQSIDTLKNKMKFFDLHYWSKYDANGRIASSFYHKLHIAQLKALSLTFQDKLFEEYFFKWERVSKKAVCRFRAFLIKSYQKLFLGNSFCGETYLKSDKGGD